MRGNNTWFDVGRENFFPLHFRNWLKQTFYRVSRPLVAAKLFSARPDDAPARILHKFQP